MGSSSRRIIRGTGSTRITNRNQGGGKKKWAPPSSVGVPANLANLYATNSVPYNSMVNSMTITCSTQTVDSLGVDIGNKIIYFQNSVLSFSPLIGMTISSGSFVAIITDIKPSGGVNVNTDVYYTSYTGTPPSVSVATYTIKTIGCP